MSGLPERPARYGCSGTASTWRSPASRFVDTRTGGRRSSTREAYSHEEISSGFWRGDTNVRAPVFYSYTAPEPVGLPYQPLQPEAAFWADAGGSSMAMLMYDDLRKMTSPKTALLDFLESTYHAGSRTAGWNEEAFATKVGS
ncbi:MAG: hypothetical protein JOZ19_03080 [Rubrobacter sp.]|nr:hypothetical protein [Rubrobacter sp.]